MATAKKTKFQVRSDASKQRWVRDDLKESYWRKHIAAWKRRGMSKRGYCKANNLSESSFNAWCREIALRESEYAPTTNAAELLADKENPFVPIRLVPDKSPKEPQPVNAPALLAASSEGLVEISVPGGAVLRVRADCAVEFVAQLFSTLKSEASTCRTSISRPVRNISLDTRSRS